MAALPCLAAGQPRQGSCHGPRRRRDGDASPDRAGTRVGPAHSTAVVLFWWELGFPGRMAAQPVATVTVVTRWPPRCESPYFSSPTQGFRGHAETRIR